MGQFRQPVDRYQIHQVHKEDPDKDGQSEWRYQIILGCKGTAHTAVDEFRHPLDEVLPASRRIRGRGFSGLAEHPEEKNTQSNGPEHGVDIDGPETHFLGFFCRAGKTPAVFRMITEGPVLKMMLDIAG